MEKNNTILFGVVCFREEFNQSLTYKRLIESFKNFDNKTTLNVFIFDNTDLPNWIIDSKVEESYINLYYKHSPDNPGFSAAVNHFSEFSKNRFDWIVILDQDTELPIDFISKYYEFVNSEYNYKLAFPKVYSNQKLISPCKYRNYRASQITAAIPELIEINDVSAINSGLIIYTNFLLENNGYNKLLRLDFCDHEFFERINKKKIVAKLLDISLNQNFSSNTDDKDKAITRYKLYLQDMFVYRKQKNQLLFFLRVDLPHLAKLTIKYKSLKFLKLRLL